MVLAIIRRTIVTVTLVGKVTIAQLTVVVMGIARVLVKLESVMNVKVSRFFSSLIVVFMTIESQFSDFKVRK